MRAGLRALIFAVGLGGAAATGAAAAEASSPDFDATERARILAHGPWPMPWRHDPSNRASGKPRAIALGRRLFSDARLSAGGKVSCATCHQPERAWTDGRHKGRGLETVERNTPSLLDVRYGRWFGWDGAGDSLWSQSIRPILDPRELGASAEHVKALFARDRPLAQGYRAVFARAAIAEPVEAVLVNAAKALAAFQETLISGRSPFDDFRDALARGDHRAMARYPAAAQRGLKIFVGKGNCHFCHAGPAFTNGEFHDIGVPHFSGPGRVDTGRQGGIVKLKASPYNLLGAFNDDPSRTTAWTTRHVMAQHRNFGEFKVPSLRNVALTSPYMHNGLLIGLTGAILHYSELDESRVHTQGPGVTERILRRLDLNRAEVTDLVAFLESLTSKPAIPSARKRGS